MLAKCDPIGFKLYQMFSVSRKLLPKHPQGEADGWQAPYRKKDVTDIVV